MLTVHVTAFVITLWGQYKHWHATKSEISSHCDNISQVWGDISALFINSFQYAALCCKCNSSDHGTQLAELLAFSNHFVLFLGFKIDIAWHIMLLLTFDRGHSFALSQRYILAAEMCNKPSSIIWQTLSEWLLMVIIQDQGYSYAGRRRSGEPALKLTDPHSK